MKILRPLSILTIFLAGLLMLPASAMAQTQLLPPPGAPRPLLPPPGMPKPVAPAKKEKPKPPVAAKKAAPATTPKPAETPTPTATVTPAPVFDDPNVDLVYGAYQRGQYKTAFDLATNRAQFNGDPKAMTMLGEL
ncbi:MAG: HcpA family protein, partial [Bradyrhizobium sp.]|nr:HcpA family protein [Bradyrhizobium sp.]